MQLCAHSFSLWLGQMLSADNCMQDVMSILLHELELNLIIALSVISIYQIYNLGRLSLALFFFFLVIFIFPSNPVQILSSMLLIQRILLHCVCLCMFSFCLFLEQILLDHFDGLASLSFSLMCGGHACVDRVHGHTMHLYSNMHW